MSNFTVGGGGRGAARAPEAPHAARSQIAGERPIAIILSRVGPHDAPFDAPKVA